MALRRSRQSGNTAGSPWLAVAAVAIFLYFFLPLGAVFARLPPAELVRRLQSAQALSALALSLRTSSIALLASIALGLPLAYWLSRSRGRFAGVIETLMQLPVVVPPAVAGVGLLLVFGRVGLFGNALAALGITIPFTWVAVVLAHR